MRLFIILTSHGIITDVTSPPECEVLSVHKKSLHSQKGQLSGYTLNFEILKDWLNTTISLFLQDFYFNNCLMTKWSKSGVQIWKSLGFTLNTYSKVSRDNINVSKTCAIKDKFVLSDYYRHFKYVNKLTCLSFRFIQFFILRVQYTV